MSVLKWRDPTTGLWSPVSYSTQGAQGESGPTGPPGLDGTDGIDGVTGPTGGLGPTGPMGVNTVILGAFGPGIGGTGTPATLPPSGLLPAGFASTGSPSYQMEPGESLFYDDPDIARAAEHGLLYQFVTEALQTSPPAGWLEVGEIVGPPGADGLDGATGPTGPTGVTGPMTNEVFIGNDLPTGPDGDQVEMWYDLDDNRKLYANEVIPGGLTGNVLVKASDQDHDTVWSGGVGQNVVIGDNAGFLFSGGGGIIKKSGGGWVLRRHNNNANIPVENNDGTGSQNIILSGGTVEMTAPLSWTDVADVAKLYLYATTFGLGITSGTLNIFASSTIKFNQNGITGTEWAHIDAAGLGPLTTSNVSWQNGFSGTADLHKTPAMVSMRLTQCHRNTTTNHNTQTKLFDLPSGIPAPPGASTAGWRTPIQFRSDNFGADYQKGTIHVDGTAVWVIVTGSSVGSGGYFDCTMSWPRVS